MIPIQWTRGTGNSPFDALYQVRREMDRLFDGWNGPAVSEPAAWLLTADVQETDDAIRFTIEVPGLRPEDIELTVENGVLTVAGERKADLEDGREGYRLVERRFGRFERSFRVPGNVRTDAVNAACEHGVLTITLPKTEEAKPRRIRIERGTGSRQIATGA